MTCHSTSSLPDQPAQAVGVGEGKVENVVQFDKAPVWYHVASQDNAADRTTRLQTVPSDLGFDSVWLNGPAYLRQPFELWPVNRNFADRKSKVKLPMEEIRKPYRERLDDGGDLMMVRSVAAGADTVGPSSLDNAV